MPVQQIGSLIKDCKKLKRHLLIVIALTLVVAALAAFFLDQRASLFFADPDIRATYWQPARSITHIALSEYYFALALGAWAIGAFLAPRLPFLSAYKKQFDFVRRWGLNFFVALILCGVITHIIKFLTGRQRPHKTPDFDPFVFDPVTTHWHWHSFSSGHSQVIFTAATMFALLIPRLRWLWFVGATGICLTRVIIHDHFVSDILVGAAVGYIGTLLALRVMQTKTKNGLF